MISFPFLFRCNLIVYSLPCARHVAKIPLCISTLMRGQLLGPYRVQQKAQKQIVLRLGANTCKGIVHVAVVYFCDRVFAELDDKTPLAMLLSAAEHNTSNVGVCIASSGALVRSKLHRGRGWFPAFDLYPASRTQAHCRGRLHGHRQLGSHRLTSLTSRSA